MKNVFLKHKLILSVICICLIYYTICPTIYAMGPEEIMDYYGNIEYIGKDSYGYYNNCAYIKPENHSDISIEKDVYSDKSSCFYIHKNSHLNTYDSQNSFDKFCIKLHWYSWKKYTKKYESFSHFKQAWYTNKFCSHQKKR